MVWNTVYVPVGGISRSMMHEQNFSKLHYEIVWNRSYKLFNSVEPEILFTLKFMNYLKSSFNVITSNCYSLLVLAIHNFQAILNSDWLLRAGVIDVRSPILEVNHVQWCEFVFGGAKHSVQQEWGKYKQKRGNVDDKSPFNSVPEIRKNTKTLTIRAWRIQFSFAVIVAKLPSKCILLHWFGWNVLTFKFQFIHVTTLVLKSAIYLRV